MNMINKGIPYFPTPANFFDEEVMELLEAKFGVLASYMVMRLLCKIHKETYEKYGILTSEQIQRVWFEATTRRKIDFSQLPYLLETKQRKRIHKDELNKENANIFPTQEEVSSENADISRQTKLKETKLNTEEEEEISDASFEIPGYAYNQATHNMNGLIESLERHKVTNLKERQTILRLSDYGRKGTQVWKLLSNTAWSKIGAPGKYIIAALASGRK